MSIACRGWRCTRIAPSPAAELDPTPVGTLDQRPEGVRAGFLDPADTCSDGIRVDLAPRAIRSREHGVPGLRPAIVRAEGEPRPGREGVVREEPDDAMLPGVGEVEVGGAFVGRSGFWS